MAFGFVVLRLQEYLVFFDLLIMVFKVFEKIWYLVFYIETDPNNIWTSPKVGHRCVMEILKFLYIKKIQDMRSFEKFCEIFVTYFVNKQFSVIFHNMRLTKMIHKNEFHKNDPQKWDSHKIHKNETHKNPQKWDSKKSTKMRLTKIHKKTVSQKWDSQKIHKNETHKNP